MLSRLFSRRNVPPPQFGQSLLIVLVLIFGLIAQIKPAVGLAGLGTVALIGALLVELNRVRIWETYRKQYKKRKGLSKIWHEPRQIYYTLNVALLWPFVAISGITCLWVAYLLA